MRSRRPGNTLNRQAASSRDFAVPGDAYAKLASVYDWVFGLPLQPGRVAAVRQLAIHSGESVLEVGVGTGLNLPLYPRGCRVTGIDVSRPMLERAAYRAASRRLSHVRLLLMDASSMQFSDGTFEVVYAPYLVTAAPDPVQVGREMARVCAPGGRIAILNHFVSRQRTLAWCERRLLPLGLRCGFRPDLDMDEFLDATGLEPIRVDRVNFPPIWSLVICRPPGSRNL